MGVRIKIAAGAAELDQLFQVRHRVFVEQLGHFPPAPDGRLVDRFDAFPTTANVVAVHEGRVVGGVRIVEPSTAGAPADALFDFRPYLPEGAVSGSGSMLVMEEAFRSVPRVTFAMLGMMYYWALCKGLTHITGLAAPDAVELFLGSGYKAVARPVLHPPSGLPALPVMLAIVELNDRFTAFVDRQSFRHFLHSFERQFHEQGETILRRGDPGSAAYVVIEGKVGVSVGGRVVQPEASADQVTPPSALGGPPGRRPSEPPSSRAGALPVRELGPGEVFGELALLTSSPRSADVVALTDVDLMVLEREAFHRQISQNPEVALNLLSVIGNRLMSVTDRLNELRERDAGEGPLGGDPA